VLTISAWEMFTADASDCELSTEVFVADRARAATL
jgi:hypothetical protein